MTESINESWYDLGQTSLDLLVNIGLLSSTAGNWPEDVQENFERKIDKLNEYLNKQIGEFQIFGEALDQITGDDCPQCGENVWEVVRNGIAHRCSSCGFLKRVDD